MQISECVPLFKEDIFLKHGLKLELKQATGGAVILSSLLGGGLDVGFSNLVSPILARSQGADVVAFAGCTYEDSKYSGHALMVDPASGIKSARDLVGKTIAINTLRNIDHLMLLSWLRDQGVSGNDIKLMEVPFPRMATMLQGKEVSAIAVVEPFLAIASQQGYKSIGNYYVTKSVGRVEVTSYIAKSAWLSENSQTAKAFKDALGESIDYYSSRPAEFREAIRSLTKLDKKFTDEINLPAFAKMPTAEGVDYLIKRLKEENFLEKPVDAKSVIRVN